MTCVYYYYYNAVFCTLAAVNGSEYGRNLVQLPGGLGSEEDILTNQTLSYFSDHHRGADYGEGNVMLDVSSDVVQSVILEFTGLFLNRTYYLYSTYTAHMLVILCWCYI